MKKLAIGLMSGTSLDGIDAVLVEIDEDHSKPLMKVIQFHTYPYDENLLEKIRLNMNPNTSDVRMICSLNYELAEAYSKAVFSLCEEAKVELEDIDFIASHGQTMYHITEESGYVKSSLQIGDGSVIANLTGIKVVSDFRNSDIAVGGQGAPLVPFAHHFLFASDAKTRVIQNIGGIANVTYLEKNKGIDEVIAFDNGPGNMMIDRAMKLLYGKNYDDFGMIAKKGKRIEELFEEVTSLDYFSLLPPKSTGREIFGDAYTDYLLKKYADYDKRDIVATMTHIAAYGIARSYRDFLPINKIDDVYLCGGGAHNQTLVSLIKEYSGIESVHQIESLGQMSDEIEALAFVILAYNTLNNQPSNVPNATGASKKVILGKISPVFRQEENK